MPDGWQRVPLVGSAGELRAPGEVADTLGREGGSSSLLLIGHRFGSIAPYARLLCAHLERLGRPWAVEADLDGASDAALLRTARASGCRALVIGPDPDPLRRAATGATDPVALRATAALLRRIRRIGLATIVHLRLGCDGDDAGVFGDAVRLGVAGRVSFPRLEAAVPERDDVRRGIDWAERTLHSHGAIWRRAGLRPNLLVANYQSRRRVAATPRALPTIAMRLARAVARPIRIRERVRFVSTLATAVQASGEHVRTAWLRARAVRDETVAALVVRLDGAIDVHAAKKLASRIRRTIGKTQERIVIDLAGVEQVSLTVLTRFLDENAGRLGDLRGRLAFRNLRPALDALRRNLGGMLPNAAILEHGLEEAS